MSEERKNEPPFGLSMGFDEALEHFVRVEVKQVKKKIMKRKKSGSAPSSLSPAPKAENKERY